MRVRVFKGGRSPLRAVGSALRPHWGALLALGLLLAAGLAILGDYGVYYDEFWERRITPLHLRYLIGDDEGFFSLRNADHLYGVAFKAPLLFVERAFGLQNDRGIYLARHLLIHLTFLISGLFAYMLARRLFGAWPLAVGAMLLFLLHPRLYAHSFFNSKDIPFLAMFMVALFLTHRAFRRDSLSAFALLGVGVGLLMNLRIMGVVLLAAVPGLRALDFALAPGWEERKRLLLTTGAFVLASALTIFASLPYLWGAPFRRAVEWWATSSDHPTAPVELFRGTLYRSADFPAEYLPLWFSISSPPFALALGALGAAALLRRIASRPYAAFRDARLRLGLLAAGCFAAPVAGVILLDANMYNGWRQMFFLWAPFSLLAMFGLRRLLDAFGQRRLRRAVCAAASAGLGLTIVSIALLHPFQHSYFNFLVDRTTPENLNAQYTTLTGNWAYPAVQSLLSSRPSGEASVAHSQPAVRALAMLREEERARVSLAPHALAEFSLRSKRPGESERTLARESVYGSVVWAVVKEKPGVGRLLAAYEQAAASAPVAREAWDVYLNRERRLLVYVRDPCGQSIENVHFYLFVYPEDIGDLRSWEEADGRADLSFNLYEFGAPLDGICAAAVPLPDYEVAGIRTGQPDPPAWEAAFPFAAPEAYRAAYERAAPREPSARGVFDVYVDGAERALTYVKEPCGPLDASSLFFLHVTPERRADLPDDRRGVGFDNLDFEFSLRGIAFENKCVALVPLPDYKIATARTGQHRHGKEIWETEFAVAE